MYIFILLVHIIVSFILVAVILLQAGRGGGLAETFGGGGGQTTIFGQKASTFLTRATTIAAVLFLCTSLALALISSRREKSLMEAARIAPAAKQAPQAEAPAGAEEAKTAKTTVREVKVDPVTGKETVVKEEVLPAQQESKQEPAKEQAP